MKVAIVGDIFLGEQHWTFSRGCVSQLNKGMPLFDTNLEKIIAQVDYFIGNLETPVLERRPLDPANFCFATSPMAVKKLLAHTKCLVLSVANNHILDHGMPGYQQTIRVLQELGVPVLGSKDILPDDPFHYIEVSNEPRLAIGAFCAASTGLAYNDVIWMLDEDKVLEAVQHASAQARWVVVLLHWGQEFVGTPSYSQVIFLRRLVEAGASVIVGHHPHVLHPIVANDETIIASSLGNFIFDQYWFPNACQGAVLWIESFPEGLSARVFHTKIERQLPVKLINKKYHEVSRQEIPVLNNKLYTCIAWLRCQQYRILARLDLLLHAWPNFRAKLACMRMWSRSIK